VKVESVRVHDENLLLGARGRRFLRGRFRAEPSSR